MLRGSCLCGEVAYEVEALASPIGHCHCHTCRKAHSAAYATTALVKRADFRWTRGDDVRAAYESTPGKLRHFCPRCGSHLMAEWVDRDGVILRLGSLDTDPGEQPVVHIWTSHDVPWMGGEDLPRLPKGAPK